ncbi:MAG: hypothetical protein IPO75_15945 [Betaproteobacteria bacterium]|nr:hypothetical protein [Betaproteobacteria bacterium]
MTTLTLAKLAEIEAAAAKATGLGRWYNNGELQFCEQDAAHIALCDPATVAALCRVAQIAVRWAHEPHELRNRSPATGDLLDALRDAGLLEP